MQSPHNRLEQISRPETEPAVIELSPQSLGEICERQYDQMVTNFKDLFAICKPYDAPVGFNERQIDIVTARYTQGQIAAKAIVRATIPSFSQYAVGYKEADGFEVFSCDYSSERENTATTYTLFSLGHRGCEDDQKLYSGSAWNLERARHTKAWLSKHVPLSRIMLTRLLHAASDPNLNPELAHGRVTVNQQRDTLLR